jgi:hypothetical protein
LPKTATDPLTFTTRLPAAAAGSPPHRHAHLTETFVVLEGSVLFRHGSYDRTLGAGEAITVRPRTIHGFRNVSPAPACLRCTVTPGVGIERFLRGMQAAAESGRTNAAGLPRNPRQLARLLLDADFHFPGPPMGLQRRLFTLLAAASVTTSD